MISTNKTLSVEEAMNAQIRSQDVFSTILENIDYFFQDAVEFLDKTFEKTKQSSSKKKASNQIVDKFYLQAIQTVGKQPEKPAALSKGCTREEYKKYMIQKYMFDSWNDQVNQIAAKLREEDIKNRKAIRVSPMEKEISMSMTYQSDFVNEPVNACRVRSFSLDQIYGKVGKNSGNQDSEDDADDSLTRAALDLQEYRTPSELRKKWHATLSKSVHNANKETLEKRESTEITQSSNEPMPEQEAKTTNKDAVKNKPKTDHTEAKEARVEAKPTSKPSNVFRFGRLKTNITDSTQHSANRFKERRLSLAPRGKVSFLSGHREGHATIYCPGSGRGAQTILPPPSSLSMITTTASTPTQRVAPQILQAVVDIPPPPLLQEGASDTKRTLQKSSSDCSSERSNGFVVIPPPSTLPPPEVAANDIGPPHASLCVHKGWINAKARSPETGADGKFIGSPRLRINEKEKGHNTQTASPSIESEREKSSDHVLEEPTAQLSHQQSPCKEHKNEHQDEDVCESTKDSMNGEESQTLTSLSDGGTQQTSNKSFFTLEMIQKACSEYAEEETKKKKGKKKKKQCDTKKSASEKCEKESVNEEEENNGQSAPEAEARENSDDDKIRQESSTSDDDRGFNEKEFDEPIETEDAEADNTSKESPDLSESTSNSSLNVQAESSESKQNLFSSQQSSTVKSFQPPPPKKKRILFHFIIISILIYIFIIVAALKQN